MGNLFNTIRLIDLIDTDTQSIDDLYKIVDKNLRFIFDKKVYPVNNADLWADFIERLCDRYFNRYLSFDTYYTFSIKLKFLIENNRAKYLQIYNASLKDIDPLITFFEDETTNEDRNTNSTNKTTNESDYNSTSETNDNATNMSENTQTTGSSGENVVSNNLKEKRTDNSTNTTTHTTTDNRVIEGLSSNPKSQSTLAETLANMTYIDNQRLQITKNDYEDATTNGGNITTDNTGKQITTNKDSVEVKDKGKTTDNRNSYNKTTGNSKGDTNTAYEDKINALITRARKGFNGNQTELLEKYARMVFDLNREIIDDINNANLFMNTLC